MNMRVIRSIVTFSPVFLKTALTNPLAGRHGQTDGKKIQNQSLATSIRMSFALTKKA